MSKFKNYRNEYLKNNEKAEAATNTNTTKKEHSLWEAVKVTGAALLGFSAAGILLYDAIQIAKESGELLDTLKKS